MHYAVMGAAAVAALHLLPSQRRETQLVLLVASFALCLLLFIAGRSEVVREERELTCVRLHTLDQGVNMDYCGPLPSELSQM